MNSFFLLFCGLCFHFQFFFYVADIFYFLSILLKSKGFKKALVESCQAQAVEEIWIFAPIQAIQLFAEKTMFCFGSALYWTENKKFVDKAHLYTLCSVQAKIRLVLNILIHFYIDLGNVVFFDFFSSNFLI